MQQLYDRNFPADWISRMGEPEVWQDIHNVDPGELWETHNALKNLLLAFVRRRVSRQCRRRGESDDVVEAARNMLDPNVLTIGFARRFATYKRADLIADRHRPAGRPGQRLRAARAVHLRRQGASGRRAGQAAHPEDRQPAARSAVRRPRRRSSKTTTSTSAGTWCRASTCGSTTRAVRWKPRARAVRRSCSTAA